MAPISSTRSSKIVTVNTLYMKIFYLHNSCQLTETNISFGYFIWVIKIDEDGQGNAQQTHHQI